MYLSHYGLTKKPFSISPDPDFLWLGENHLEALATLKYGIQENKGFLLLTGGIGVGKTAMVNRVIKTIGAGVRCALIYDPHLDLIDFYNILAEEFKLNKRFSTKGDFLIHFKRFLLKIYNTNGSALLIIDEAQRISQNLLDEIRVLSNIEIADRKILNIFFVGQTEFNKMLLEEQNMPLKQRITVRYHIDPLTDFETEVYIEYRIKVAGGNTPLFSPDAISEIYRFSGGIPRLINIICDHALLTGYVAGNKLIDKNIIKECQKELSIPDHSITPENKKAYLSSEKPRSVSKKNHEKLNKIAVSSLIIMFIWFIAYFGYTIYSLQPKRTSFLEEKNANSQLQPQIPTDNLESIDQEFENGRIIEKKSNTERSPDEKFSEEIFITKKDTEIEEKKNFLTKGDVRNNRISDENNIEEITESQNNQDVFINKENGQNDDDNKDIDHLKPMIEKKLIVRFKYNSDELLEGAKEKLNELIKIVSQQSDFIIYIVGYTDSLGGIEYNQYLSKIRAEIVKSYFINKGIASNQIYTAGMGQEKPIESNETPEGRAKNRRVEITVNLKNNNDL